MLFGDIMVFHEPSTIEVALTKIIMTIIEGPFYKKYVNEMDLKGDENVLEFGPGPGKMSKYLVRALPRGHLTCVDLSRVWPRVVRKVLREYPNVDIMQGKIFKLPIADGSFDVVVASFVIHDVDDEERQQVVDTLAAKLKKGGRIFVRDPEVQNGKWHGISGAGLRKVMQDSGLKELSFERRKPFYMGPLHQGVYVKE